MESAQLLSPSWPACDPGGVRRQLAHPMPLEEVLPRGERQYGRRGQQESRSLAGSPASVLARSCHRAVQTPALRGPQRLKRQAAGVPDVVQQIAAPSRPKLTVNYPVPQRTASVQQALAEFMGLTGAIDCIRISRNASVVRFLSRIARPQQLLKRRSECNDTSIIFGRWN